MEGDKVKQKEQAPVKAPIKRFSDDFYLYTFKIAQCKAEYPVGAWAEIAAPALVCISHTSTYAAHRPYVAGPASMLICIIAVRLCKATDVFTKPTRHSELLLCCQMLACPSMVCVFLLLASAYCFC
jgi:hypothetical protein